jgi:hypothetical protein
LEIPVIALDRYSDPFGCELLGDVSPPPFPLWVLGQEDELLKLA